MLPPVAQCLFVAAPTEAVHGEIVDEQEVDRVEQTGLDRQTRIRVRRGKVPTRLTDIVLGVPPALERLGGRRRGKLAVLQRSCRISHRAGWIEQDPTP